jgi:transcriptional regulator with XRE-family HTH domain
MAKRTPPTSVAGRRQLAALGARLRAARLRREMSQAALAEKVGVHVQTILKLESGNPATSLATMLLVLKALGMAADIDALASEDHGGA